MQHTDAYGRHAQRAFGRGQQRPAGVRDLGPHGFVTSPIRVIDGELDETTRIPRPRRLPPVPPPRPAGPPSVGRRVASSAFAADVRRYGWLLGLLLAAVLCAVLTRGQYLTWDGWQTIPTGGVR